MSKHLTYTILFALLIVSVLGCKSYYLAPNAPQWLDNTISSGDESKDSLKIVSYNIQEAKNIDVVIEEVTNITGLKDFDVILVQEMDLKGVVELSTALNLNYLYYPIANFRKKNRDVGNGILSTYKLESPQKVILPYKKFMGKGRRMSCAAVINYNNVPIRLHSIHLETIVMSRKKRLEQLDEVLEHANDESDVLKHYIIGGDFNSLFRKDRTSVVYKMTRSNFHWDTPDLRPTGTVPLNIMKPQLDHIFSSGFELIDYGVCTSCEASDHRPIWTVLKIKK